ncbi:MAG: M48 family metalloprotease [Oligoflexia bacterium]|nr:M48 family metalloprotease [Oligoflexia bacterium]
MRVVLGVILGLVFSVNSWAKILPDNNLHLFDNYMLVNDPVKERQFNEIIDHIIEMWKPLAQANGATLVAEKRWNDPTVNAYAQQSGSTWKVTMFGGLFRRPEVTPDAFALVVCHELGHHFAGYAFYGHDDWASSEGQSDYWATQVCGRKIFEKTYSGNSKYRFNLNTGRMVPPYVQERCNATWKDSPSQDRCYRLAAAGLSLATLLGKLGSNPAPKFETPDQSRVSKTVPSHPKAQCRLDTYFYGALCPINLPDLRLIPGKGAPGGNNSIQAQRVAAEVSCMESKGFKIGQRPACWFGELKGDADAGFQWGWN